MWFLISFGIIFAEGAKYIWNASEQRSLVSILFQRLSRNDVPRKTRPVLLAYIVVNGLRARHYALALQALRDNSDEFPWANMSNDGLRKIFETAVLFDEESLILAAFHELESRDTLGPSEIETLQALRFWAAGRLDASTVDLNRTYFAFYPASDEWLKGEALTTLGLPDQAKERFRRCASLAGTENTSLREEALRRLRPRTVDDGQKPS